MRAVLDGIFYVLRSGCAWPVSIGHARAPRVENAQIADTSLKLHMCMPTDDGLQIYLGEDDLESLFGRDGRKEFLVTAYGGMAKQDPSQTLDCSLFFRASTPTIAESNSAGKRILML